MNPKTRLGRFLFEWSSIGFAIAGWLMLTPLLAAFCVCLAISRVLHYLGEKIKHDDVGPCGSATYRPAADRNAHGLKESR
jgi:hypothetical protein